ncbi:FAD-binding oxidoreductase, partial [Frankia sp. EI5c]|uniref:FAD-binding oxidoreductase n=1 Tax=Frankia sp. EI5c TaxID=683316 RepID=UPI001A7E3E52
GDPGYDAERAAFNTFIQHHPRAIVLAENARDAAVAVRIGAGLGLPIAVQATGHGIGVPADGALLINLRKLTGVTVDQRRRTARINGGVPWRDVLTAAAPLGLLPPVGSTSHVGATGYTTGGGVPILGRTSGYAADQVRSIELVTPDGRPRSLSPDHEPDLFWAVRGGKSNFGVVTSFEIGLLPVATVYGGSLAFPAESVERAYQAYAAWTSTVSDRMTSVATFLRYPDLPQIPPDRRGRLWLLIEIVYVGSETDGAAELGPLRALGPTTDTVAPVPAAQLDTVFNVPTTPGITVSATGLIRSLDAGGVASVLRAVGPGVVLPAGFVEIRHLGGGFGRRPRTPSAIGHRDAGFLVFLSNTVPDPALVEPVVQRQQALLTELGPLLTGGRVPSFLGPFETSAQAVRSAYDPADWTRLLALKRRHDPDNLFRINHNIR